MIRPFDEPSTEDEAQELNRFLEQGAEVSLETVRRFTAERTSLTVPDPAAITFSPIGDMAAALEEAGGNDALMRLEFNESSLTPDFAVGLFLNTPDADAATSAEVPGFLGSIAFFCHTEERDGVLVCVVHEDAPARYSIPLSRELQATDLGTKPTLTLVPFPIHAEVTTQTLEVVGSLDLVRSTVAEES